MVILLVANAVQNAMVGADTSLEGGLVSAATLLAINAGVARIRVRSVRFRQLVEGVPAVLVQYGELVLATLRRERITDEEVVAAVREHGQIGDISQVELAVLEGGWVGQRRAPDGGCAAEPPPLEASPVVARGST